MEVKKIFEEHYKCIDELTKHEWAASNIFDLATYDGELAELFVNKIFEVCNVILERRNFEYITNRKNYITYILVCQILDKKGWINWGTSIRGAWFEMGETMFESGTENEVVPFTNDNLRILMDFVKGQKKECE